jgi:hypothetical protein
MICEGCTGTDAKTRFCCLCNQELCEHEAEKRKYRTDGEWKSGWACADVMKCVVRRAERDAERIIK